MAQKATDRIIGTCIWFKNVYGYIGYGLFTNNQYEGQIYAHYKQIPKKGHRHYHTRLDPGDICEFTSGDPFYCESGSQALNIKVLEYAEDKGQVQGRPSTETDEGTEQVG